MQKMFPTNLPKKSKEKLGWGFIFRSKGKENDKRHDYRFTKTSDLAIVPPNERSRERSMKFIPSLCAWLDKLTHTVALHTHPFL